MKPALRRRYRALDHAPCETSTFLAVRVTGLTAPANIEQILVPTLHPGDFVSCR